MVQTPGRWRVAGVAFWSSESNTTLAIGRKIAAERGFLGISLLDRPTYSYADAARLLRLPSQTLRRWLEGATRAGVVYPPVIRPEPLGVDFVTWGEFVEAGFLLGYRQKHVSLQKMRPFIEEMRQKQGIPYPLAHLKPLVLNKELVYELQQATLLDPRLYLVRVEGGQMLWARPVEEYLQRVEFDPAGVVFRLRPEGFDNPVAIDPEVSFGIPQIKGIRTELVAESVAGGETEEQAAHSWGLGLSEIRAALQWERSLPKAA